VECHGARDSFIHSVVTRLQHTSVTVQPRMPPPVATMTASADEAPPPDDDLILRLVSVASPSIEVISAVPNWVELLISSTREAAEITQAFVAKLEADLPHELINSIRQALRELLLNAVEWGGKLDPK
jgi:hypothetical protein